MPAVGYDGYEVSDHGRVKSLRRPDYPVILTPAPQSRGYLSVNIGLGSRGHHKSECVHKMVLEAFRGPRPSADMECRHIDGNKSNCRLDNLAWGTRAEHNSDKVRHGTALIGAANHKTKVSNENAEIIRQRLAAGETCVALGAEYGVSGSSISDIKNKVTHNGGVSAPRPARSSHRDAVLAALNADALSAKDVAAVVGTSGTAVYRWLETLESEGLVEKVSGWPRRFRRRP